MSRERSRSPFLVPRPKSLASGSGTSEHERAMSEHFANIDPERMQVRFSWCGFVEPGEKESLIVDRITRNAGVIAFSSLKNPPAFVGWVPPGFISLGRCEHLVHLGHPGLVDRSERQGGVLHLFTDVWTGRRLRLVMHSMKVWWKEPIALAGVDSMQVLTVCCAGEEWDGSVEPL